MSEQAKNPVLLKKAYINLYNYSPVPLARRVSSFGGGYRTIIACGRKEMRVVGS